MLWVGRGVQKLRASEKGFGLAWLHHAWFGSLPLPQDKFGGCESPSELRKMRLGSQDPNGDVSLHISS